MKRAFYLLTLGVSLALGGCATERYHPPPPLTGNAMVDGQNAIQHGPAKDRVLWEYRLGLTALRSGQFAEAKQNLDDAITRISNLFGKDPEARKARGFFHAEAKKTFIGEPYERAMAYYFRGILYWMDGEPDNARACFRSAALEDSDAVDKKYASDYVLLDYLDGLASVKLSADGADALQRAAANAKLSAPPPYDPKANVLFFVDYGPGPTKYAVGEYAQDLMFRAGPTPIASVQIQVAGKTFQLRPYDDLYFQATTRGGRVMDHILANKAKFKNATDAAGNVGIIGGASMAALGRGNTQLAGLGLLAAGIASKLASSATTPEADIRSWDNLPLYLTFAAVPLPPGQYTATVDFLDGANRLLLGMTKSVSFTVPDSGDKVIYVSEKSKTPQSL
jgi:tetratricopeptide (TPR) repeat protein